MFYLVVILSMIVGVAVLIYLQNRKANIQLAAQMKTQEELIRELNRQQKEWNDLLDDIEQKIREGKTDDKWIEVCDQFLYLQNVGNPIAAALIAEKSRVCKEKEIRFENNLNVPENFKVNEIALVGLIGNLLDNAIEAAEAVTDGKRFVSIQSREQAGVWSLKVENSKQSALKPDESQFATTKKDKKNHGYGMKIVRKIVDGYQGIVEMKDNGNRFSVTVSL